MYKRKELVAVSVTSLCIEESDHAISTGDQHLPAYDADLKTRTFSIIGLATSYMISLISFGFGAYVVANGSTDPRVHGISTHLPAQARDSVGLVSVAGIMIVLMVFVLSCTRFGPRGAQPSAFGHLQTLADIIDDWGEGAKRKLWWGDKGPAYSESSGQVLRRAGTSSKQDGVEQIQTTELYS